MRQSIDDGVTLEIVYEGRTHNAEVINRTGMDTAFADVFSDYNLKERMQILGYGSRDAYLEAESTIKAKAKDMINHYLTHVFPNGYKAQIVATSREAAARYKTHVDSAIAEAVVQLTKANPGKIDLDQLKKLKTDVIISGNHNDPLHLKEYSDGSRHEASIKSFKLPFEGEDEGVKGDIGILIVTNMLITGFDARPAIGLSWIYEKIGHPQKYRDLPHPRGKELVSGESALYLGRQYRIEVVQKGLPGVHFAQKFLIPTTQIRKKEEALREWYIAKAKEKIIPQVKHYAHHLGVNIKGIRIVDNRFRWGSCTINDNVNFNWRLIKAPMFVIDYVIMHELAHLMESNHTPMFWDIVRAQAPTMDKAKGWLKEHGQLLEQSI